MEYCNQDFHNGLNNEYVNCPFCDIKLCLPNVYVREPCCGDPNMNDDEGYQLCFNCGQVGDPVFVNKYVCFYDNMYLFYRNRKSIYMLTDLSLKSGVDIDYYDERKIQRIFKVVVKCIPYLDYKIKRLISIKFIIRKILCMMGKPYEYIENTYSDNTLKMYERIWTNIIVLCGYDIYKIIF